jgi:excisionase family DNA binding protein
MSSNIQVKRICICCNAEFIARTTITKFCSKKCNSRWYKSRSKAAKIERSEKETSQIKAQALQLLKGKEFLTAKEVGSLLGCSVRTVYNLIQSGSINAVNFGQRITRVRAIDLNSIFEERPMNQPKIEVPEFVKAKKLTIEDCYSLSEIMNKYNISDRGLYQIIERHGVPKMRKGKFTFVSKDHIDEILTGNR